jgi:ATP-dependent helicase/nuclease subunit A
MLVEAAAGTGKTTSLVTRVIGLLRSGRCDIAHVAAVTFTLKAAAQLRAKLQEELEGSLHVATGEEARRLEAATRDLDHAFVGTTHAFCARLLRERPIEAGLDPEFEELDAVEAVLSAVDFFQRWLQGRAALGDPAITAARDAGLDHDLLRNAFVSLVQHHGDVTIVSEACEPPDLRTAAGEVLEFLQSIEHDLPDDSTRTNQDPFERMIRKMFGIIATHDLTTSRSQLELLEEGASPKKPVQKNWPDRKRAKQYGDDYDALAERTVKPAIRAWREYVHCIAMDVLRPALDDYENERRTSGRLTFNDLLLGARNLLRDHRQVRRYFQRRFTHVLVDEFQDTDPLQAEVLFYLTGEEGDERDWRRLTPRPASLFIVGDPKQSIYRFRRADITTYMTVRRRIQETGGRIVSLSTNFRSSTTICAHVNSVFSLLLDEASVAGNIQAPHVDLDPHHEGGAIDGVFLLESASAAKAEIARSEAERIAAWIRRAVDSGWKIHCENGEREATWGDFMLISRYTTRLEHYAAALEQEGVPFEVTGAHRFGDSRWLHATLPLLRAVADPDDAVSLVSFLRGPYCGAADDEFADFVARGGRWSPFRELPEGTPSSVAEGFALIRESIEDARNLPAGAAIAKIFERVGVAARAAAAEQPRTAAGNTLLALTLARAESNRGETFAAVVERLAALLEADLEIEEMDVDPEREDVVRLMNLHQVKGLEAPVVFLIDGCESKQHAPGSHIDRSGEESRGYFPIRRREGAWGVLTDVALPQKWESLAAIEQRFTEAEETRLLYVAATRARNVLVVGAVAKNGALEGVWSRLLTPALSPLFTLDAERASEQPTVPGTESYPEALAAIEGRRDAAGLQSYSVVPVTRIAHDSHEKLVRAEEGLGMGTSWGRVLHRLFEAMLRQPELDVRFYAASLLKDEERDAAELEEVVSTVKAVRSSPLWQRVIAADETYAEIPFALNVDARSIGIDRDGDTLLHGTIDLVFREGAKWFIVDYKSDSTQGRLESLVQYYTPQVAHYARFWRELTGAETEAGLFFVDGCMMRWV